ncbi:MAG: SH3 domain-containing protein [Aggregatilineales bacterium]
MIARRAERIGFVGTLLAFLAASTLALSVALAAVDGTSLVQSAVLITASVVVALSAILLASERKRQLAWRDSRGLLGVGLGIVTCLSALFVWTSADALLAVIAPSPTPATVAPTPPSTLVEPTRQPTKTPTPSLTPTPSRTQTSTPTARGLRPSRTPTPTLTPVTPCLAQTLYNINLRAGPSRASQLLTTIPFDTTVSLFARTADSAWWLTYYEGAQGWLAGEFLDLTSACQALPIQD